MPATRAESRVPGIVYLNGVFLSADEAQISPFDRGFLFADGVYEVAAVFGGKLVDLPRHLARLERSLGELGYPRSPDRRELEAIFAELVARNGIDEGLVYLQVTRGAYGGRDFSAPEEPRLTVFAFAEEKKLVDPERFETGVRAIAAPDIRWGRCDIKSVGLLAAAMAKTEAKRRGKDDAWFVDAEGYVTEAASANAWIVTDAEEVVTRPLSSAILPGVTRHTLKDSLVAAGVKLVERPFTLAEAKAAREAFNTSAVALVMPVLELDGAAIGDGKPGPVTRRMFELYLAAIGAA